IGDPLKTKAWIASREQKVKVEIGCSSSTVVVMCFLLFPYFCSMIG
ncbi:hypothetical protein LINGRAHAP2_LOCUS3758, partial [Linum grandiflorum]